jgi:hypothetical protein
MLRYVFRALAACASIALFTLLALPVSAQFQVHPQQGGARIGTPEDPEDRFGTAVAIRSELAFISAPLLPSGGEVVVYTATPTALIPTGVRLRPSNPAPLETFGLSLAYRDGILVVGSDRAAYVFKRNSSGVWTQKQKLTAPAGDDVRSFPNALRYEEGTLAIGARTGQGGAVYIYERDAAGQFTRRQKLVSPDGPSSNEFGDGFGSAISTAGAVMVVGASSIGRAFVFRRNSAGVWRYQQTLIPSELGTGGAAFGAAVAIDRGMIVVGAPSFAIDPIDPFSPEGAAYGFTLAGSVYVEAFKLQPLMEGYDGFLTRFGYQLAMFGERIVVGAYNDINLGGISTCEFFSGAVFSYTRAGSSVLPRGVAFSRGDDHSLALADQRLLVGTPCAESIPFFAQGRATLFRLNVFE